MSSRIAVIVAGLFLSFGVLHTQPAAGTWELSLAGTAGSIKSESKYSGPYGSYSHEGEAESYVTLFFHPGYYVIDGISIEPEVIWTAIEDEPPAFSFSGNISYTYRAPESTVAPFVLVGYGIGNTIPLSQRALGRMSDELDVSLFNAGAGLKVFVSETTAFRVEYRYQTYHREHTETYGNITETYASTMVQNNVFFGFSVFL